MPTLPRDLTDLRLAPALLALDARLAELEVLDLAELRSRIALASDGAAETRDLRTAQLLATVQRDIELRGWSLTWHPRGLRLKHGIHHVVLGVPRTFSQYIEG